MPPASNPPSSRFIDYLTIEQVFPYQLPAVVDVGLCRYDKRTGEVLNDTQPGWKHEGSYSTSINIRVDGCKLIVKGNPSAVDRLDNLDGYRSIDQCVAVYNRILREYGDETGTKLPGFTKCTDWGFTQVEEGSRARMVGNGARIRRIDLTTNRTVGKGNERHYVKALSTQRFGYKNGHLFEDGNTCDWSARDHYEKAYIKARAIEKFLFPKCKRNFGPESEEFRYLLQLRDFCDANGVVRMEQELKAEYLTREGLDWWGLFDERRFDGIHEKFLAIDQKLQVTAMEYDSIAERLLAAGEVTNAKAANLTANVAMQWMHGHTFDFSKSQAQKYRARLNRIGINIAQPYDATKNVLVFVRRAEEIVTSDELVLPHWYRKPFSHLSLVSA
ncbi:MAG: hypothetical protein DI535_30005 [Citrobacter freundii]|nr:MAG: hypothetical protein DI535_30005 [Citrobacter freundii]